MAKIRVILKEFMDERGMTKTIVQRRTGLSWGTIRRLYTDSTQRIDLDVLAVLCERLEAEITDLLRYDS
jgi:putative transcriptional regulator